MFTETDVLQNHDGLLWRLGAEVQKETQATAHKTSGSDDRFLALFGDYGMKLIKDFIFCLPRLAFCIKSLLRGEANCCSIFRKGLPSCCTNHRRMSFVPIGLKLLAFVILRRLPPRSRLCLVLFKHLSSSICWNNVALCSPQLSAASPGLHYDVVSWRMVYLESVAIPKWIGLVFMTISSHIWPSPVECNKIALNPRSFSTLPLRIFCGMVCLVWLTLTLNGTVFDSECVGDIALQREDRRLSGC